MAGGEDKAKDAKKELESPLETGLLRVLFKAPQQQKKLQLYGEDPKPAESLELAKRRFRSLNPLQEGDDGDMAEQCRLGYVGANPPSEIGFPPLGDMEREVGRRQGAEVGGYQRGTA